MNSPKIPHNKFDDPVMSRLAVARQLCVSEVTLWRMVQQGLLQKPLQISARRVGWRKSTIEAFLASREAA
jgi:predicted DNA-binding transcriptional regulator AlpA